MTRNGTRTLLVCILLGVLLWVALGATACAMADAREARESGTQARESACMEDAPCWTWPTMGNRRRGIVSMSGARVIVGACRFARMARRGRIDWSRTDRLRGDRYARRQGCRVAHNPL